MKNRRLLKTIIMSLFVMFSIIVLPVKADAKPLDEILLYEIKADMNEDATVDFTYHIKWKVLDSSSEGPLSWVKIGIPNNHVDDITPLTPNISRATKYVSGGSYVRIDFDRNYYAGEVVDFTYSLKMDYMYDARPDEGIAIVEFTPGWFDGIDVDQLVVMWNADNVNSFSPSCLQEDGYLLWTTSLGSNQKYPVKVTYPLDAYGFNLEKEADTDDGYDFDKHPWYANLAYCILVFFAFIFIILVCFCPIFIPIIIAIIAYKGLTGYRVVKENKITRTKIVYHDSCPNCGGSREPGKEVCAYCGSNMIKSKDVITEEESKKLDEKILDYKTDGLYELSGHNNTYVRVHVTPVPRFRQVPPAQRSSVARSSGSSTRSHSSCAHSSCACACACACAGGGRAGCTTKDFFNTKLKLKHLRSVK